MRLLVRVAAGGHVGWGECEASPLPSIAAFVCPMSHGVCQPVADSVLGQAVATSPPTSRASRRRSRQSHGPAAGRPHLLRHRDGALGPARPRARRAGLEAARLHGEPPEDTLRLGAVRRHAGRRRSHGRARCRARRTSAPAKFGWGPIGRGSVADGRGPFRRGARGSRARTASCWSTPARSGATTSSAAAARLPALEAGRRALARGAVRGERARRVWRAREAKPRK